MHPSMFEEGVGDGHGVSSAKIDKSDPAGIMASFVIVVFSNYVGIKVVDTANFGVEVTKDKEVVSV